MRTLSVLGVQLLAMAGIAVALSSANADENVRERRNWYAADGSWFTLYKYGHDIELKISGRPLIAGKAKSRGDTLEISRNGRVITIVTGDRNTENTVVMTVDGRTATFHKISGEWYANDEAGGPRVLRLSPMYLNWELYREGKPDQNARYRFDGRRLLVSDSETGRQLGDYQVQLEDGKEVLNAEYRFDVDSLEAALTVIENSR